MGLEMKRPHDPHEGLKSDCLVLGAAVGANIGNHFCPPVVTHACLSGAPFFRVETKYIP